MPDYEKMYYRLFNVLSDIARALENDKILEAYGLIMKAQTDTEAMYLDADSETNEI